MALVGACDLRVHGDVYGNDGPTPWFYDGEVDSYLDLGEYDDSCGDNHNSPQLLKQEKELEGNERIVPAARFSGEYDHETIKFGYDFTPKADEYFCYSTDPSFTRSVSLSSSTTMEARVVPEATTVEQLFSPPSLFDQVQTQCNHLDREARVLRYREKRKTRKFVKTIRYASRKAYAEKRPRIKGRFVKRSDIELEVDQMLSSIISVDDNYYGVVPTLCDSYQQVNA